ncbi:hypothetical protein Tco_0838478 [Tanacetum coccineum]|uniref:Uncharacterized protein n=2 Tax=Tanacetum coccineum TaxID=301880 RepID=A0ABQ5ANX9_9ASTR
MEVKQFRETLLQHMSNVKKSAAKRTQSSGTESAKQDESSRSENDTDTDDAHIRPIYDEEPVAEIQEKVFTIAALKNDLRKLKGNSVDTKFAKTSVLGKPVLQSLRNQSVVRKPNAFKSKRPPMSKPRFASQVDVNNNLSKPVTQHYLPKGRASAFAKLDPMISSSSSRNSSKNTPRFSSNDMVHNYYLEEARKKTQERNRNSKSNVMHTASPQNTTNGRKPKPRSNNQTSRSFPVSKSSRVTLNVMPLVDHSRNSSHFSDSKHFVCSTCQKCIFNANHDACITKLLKEVNSRKSSAVYEKTSPRSNLRWKPTGRILNTVGLRWVPTGKIFTSCTSKTDSESIHGSNVDIFKIHECKQTLDLSAGTSINVQKKQSIDLSVVKMEILLEPTSNKLVLETYSFPSTVSTDFINGLPKKWLSFCLSLRNANHVRDFELASLFGKLRPDDEEDTRSSQEYMNDLELEFHKRALLAKYKWFFKKGTQRFSGAKATDQTECHKCGRKVKMEILLEPTSNKLMEHLKMEMEIPCSNKIKFITACSFSNDSFEDIMKAQVSVIKASATLNIQAFKIKKSVSISFRMTQVHKMAKDHMMMIKDYDWMMISKKLKDHIQVKLKPKSLKFTASDSQDTDQ